MRDHIVEIRRKEIAERYRNISRDDLRNQLGDRDQDRPFDEALTRMGISVIAEFKRKSPTRGDIAVAADLPRTVEAYERGGAAALSVLTETTHFGGDFKDLKAARQASSLPILCKDFIVDGRQLYEAAITGADAVLLIAGAVPDSELEELYEEAVEIDLDCIVEVNDSDELNRALELGADVIGINNRNFKQPRFEEQVDLDVTRELMREFPAGKTLVSESGITSRADIEDLESRGVDAVLIGTALMLADDPEAFLRELVVDEEVTREHYL